MKEKTKELLVQVVFLGIVFLVAHLAFATTFTYTYDTATPVGTDAPSVLDDHHRLTKSALQERLAVEHNFAKTGSEVSAANTGTHTAITCDSVTSSGAITGTTISGSGDFAVNTNKFTVTAASGNTLVAGTLESTGVATLGDGSLLAAATEVGDADRAIVDKGFLDGDAPTVDDSESNAMVKDHAYLTQTSGFVTAYRSSNDTTQSLSGYVGSTIDPAGAGQLMCTQGDPSNTKPSISFFVGKGKYFEITFGSTTTDDITWTPLVTGGGAPIDQD